jgi:hypothetical protein
MRKRMLAEDPNMKAISFARDRHLLSYSVLSRACGSNLW